ncbi:MAG: radical SAM protein [Treponema sp.]|nr:radical SAM protein [Treponema sp.]MCL2251819.1 radical SAM protein [Treponema sp.]
MALNITPVENHREREKGVIVYPVFSRRSEGLSIGINLFPDKKKCQFDCPYCEVFPFSGTREISPFGFVVSNAKFSLEQMQTDLYTAIENAKEQNIPIKDICFSGNGEPTLSPHFPKALKLAEKIRQETLVVSKTLVVSDTSSKIVVITNGAGFLNPQIFSLLKKTAVSSPLDIWLKLDAGTPKWYQKMNRSALSFDKLYKKMKKFTDNAPVTIQTMICAINEEIPAEAETIIWEILVCKLAEKGKVRKVQLYGKARPAPEDPLASPLPAEYLEKRAESLRKMLTDRELIVPVEVYL